MALRHPIAGLVGLILLAACPPLHARRGRQSVTPVPRRAGWWLKQHRRITEQIQRAKPRLLFVGDSITSEWKRAGQTVWSRYYGRRRALNAGIGGDQTEHLLWRLEHGGFERISPRVAVLLIGTNNLHADSVAQLIAGVVAVVKKMRRKLPRTRILLLAIFPRGSHPSAWRRKLARVNRLVAKKVADGKWVHALDIGRRFLGPGGEIKKEVMPDFLHLSAKGYAIWARAMERKLKALLALRRR